MASLALIRRLEEAFFGAWPALAQVFDDGWVLQFADGYTKRANSINPTYPALDDAEVKIDRAEGCDLNQRLEARGYQATNVARALYLSALTAEAPSLPASVTLRLDASPHDGWLEASLAMTPLDPSRAATLRRMLDGIVPVACFGWLSENGQPLAAAFAVVQGPLMSTYHAVTVPAARRRGLMRALLGRLIAWAMEEGATAGGLFVVANNEAAGALYQRLGYEELYRYHYRVAPA
ncbi:GNAT family N-acetyltransferase [Phialemonium atrogriseum]|uniref:GNAT family N-acetyltransferase n=1 Tax=Phialemonium atrogriseum TaxID=1093897 RepID=A0AAJ0BY44_9PEZI|nr:GNAT family N-acetyltransferase [Phialemonium atrogriseum]KAK1765244.1 GNAT family N-acetyltransferase [Phialemonium atrogriseum]